MSTILGITVADGGKFKAAHHKGGTCYKRVLPDGRIESIFQPFSGAKSLHLFSNPEEKTDLLKMIVNKLRFLR